jgi:hypothetical protein
MAAEPAPARPLAPHRGGIVAVLVALGAAVLVPLFVER